jgi:hypothetical protein
MTKISERMKALQVEMRKARMRLVAERMDRRLEEFKRERSAAARAEEDECGPGEPLPIGQVSARLVEALGQIARGDVERMTVDEALVRLRTRKLDS